MCKIYIGNVAVIRVSNLGVMLEILNDIELRNKNTEENLVAIGERYRQRLWLQITDNDNFVTPRKKTLQQELSDRSNMSLLNRTRQSNDKISRCFNFEAQTAEAQIVVEQPQVGNTSASQSISLYDSFEEEVMYSEGEPDKELYPDNTWDSDNEVQVEGETSSIAGWI